MIPLNCPSQQRFLGFQQPESAESLAAKEARRKAIAAAAQVSDAKQAVIQQRLAALAKEPWRVVAGVTNSIYGRGWFHFSGRVEKVCPEGVLVDGFIASLDSENEVANLNLANNSVARAPGLALPNQTLKYQQFVVTNFPEVVAAGDEINFLSYRMAKEAGTVVLTLRQDSITTRLDTTTTRQDNSTNNQDSITKRRNSTAAHQDSVITRQDRMTTRQDSLHRYDYGEVCPPPPAWLAAMAARSAKAKESTAAAILKLEQEKAAEGSDLYQYRLGRRYEAGNGVEKDLGKARELFQKAADQGNEDAVAALRSLPSAETAPAK